MKEVSIIFFILISATNGLKWICKILSTCQEGGAFLCVWVLDSILRKVTIGILLIIIYLAAGMMIGLANLNCLTLDGIMPLIIMFGPMLLMSLQPCLLPGCHG